MLRVVGQNPRPDGSANPLLTAQPVEWGRGFHGEEIEDSRRFHWMGLEAGFRFASTGSLRYLEISTYGHFHDLSQTLRSYCADEAATFDLTPGWMQLSIEIPAGADSCELTLNKPFPAAFYPGDERTLGVQIREPLLHADPARHAHVARQHSNARHNREEMLGGRIHLDSTPPVLGIDMYGVCNVKPPCVYCEWDFSKDLEGEHVDAPFDLDTLAAYGEFFDNSHQLVNCSIGEPFMMKNFDELLEAFGRQGKVLEMTTNGQILTDRNIERLVGHSIDLYISLDAGTPETYAKLRNERFEDILSNLRRLNAAKGGGAGLPRVRLVFMPMAVNQHELEDFVKICADLEVERMVLRPLNYSDSVDLRWDRSGYTFDYQKELLPFPRLVELSAEAARLAEQHGVALADQMDFGGESQSFVESFQSYPAQAPAEDPEPTADEDTPPEAEGSPPSSGEAPGEPTAATQPEIVEPALPSLGSEQEPICLEPWRSLYVLRRGTLPCCYGGEPVADFNSYREAWNGPEIIAIRESLAAGRFPTYCLNSPACPIVRKHQEAGDLPWHQKAKREARRGWFAFERATAEGWRYVLAWPLRTGVRFGVRLVKRPAQTLRETFGRPRGE